MSNTTAIYQLRLSLVEIEPEIWRQILVPADIKLPKLHLVLQAAMGWRNCHLHTFRDAENSYSPMPEENLFLDEKNIRLCDLLQDQGQILEYEYDMGDSWLHIVEIEKVLKPEAGKTYSSCIDGANDCPPEDCGGAPGYENLFDVLANSKHPEYKDMKQWLDNYGPEPFDLKIVNRHLAALAPKIPGKKASTKIDTAKKRSPRYVWAPDLRKTRKKAG